MGVIGGIFKISDNGGYTADGALAISRAMAMRGGRSKRAYINKRGAVFSGSKSSDEESESFFSIRSNDDGSALVAAVDGSILFEDRSLSADDILDLYESNGSKLQDMIYGDFALALLNEAHGELTLLRNGAGSRPLFYTRSKGSVSFASEIKGLICLSDTAHTVKRDRLCEHLFSGIGSKGQPFDDIYEVPPGGGCLISDVGISHFFYDTVTDHKENDYIEESIDVGFISPPIEELSKELFDILFAFDYPIFDPLMPSFLRCLDIINTEKISNATVADATLCSDIRYSIDRRDRLCSMRGGYVRCVPPKNSTLDERELRRIEGSLLDILSGSDKSILSSLYGKNYEERLRQEGSAARRIRIEGMLCQTPVWCEKYNPIFV